MAIERIKAAYDSRFDFFSEGELLTLPEEQERLPSRDLDEDVEQDEPRNADRTEFMPGDFFQIPPGQQLPEVAGQIEEIKECELLPGGEPDTRSDNERASSEDTNPAAREENKGPEEPGPPAREHSPRRGPEENDFN